MMSRRVCLRIFIFFLLCLFAGNPLFRNAAFASDEQAHASNRDRKDSPATLNRPLFLQAFNQLASEYDGRKDLFIAAPKALAAARLRFLLRYWKRAGDDRALTMVEKTLGSPVWSAPSDPAAVRSIDPKADRTLSDEALSALVYTETFQVTGKKEYETAARKILDGASSAMASLSGGFYSSNADHRIQSGLNGLMIAALAKAARALDEPKYAETAGKSADFILKSMVDEKGRLRHASRGNHSEAAATADDYAFLIRGLIEIYETTFEEAYLEKAISLNKDFLARYWNTEREDDGPLALRGKGIRDTVMPSGNPETLLNLLQLYRMTCDTSLKEKAEELVALFSEEAGASPSSYTQFMSVLDFAEGPSYEVVIAGNPKAEDTLKMIRTISRPFVPNKVVILRPGKETPSRIVEIAPFTEYQKSINGKATVYVCRNYNCNFPTTDPAEVLKMLGVKEKK